MPKYTFTCHKCGKSDQYFASVSLKHRKCDSCDGEMDRLLPSLRGVKSTEVVDKYTNKKHIEDQENILKERKLDYYWEVEVPKMVNSGTYSIETMLEQGWVYYNERQELTIRTKPPQKE